MKTKQQHKKKGHATGKTLLNNNKARLALLLLIASGLLSSHTTSAQTEKYTMDHNGHGDGEWIQNSAASGPWGISFYVNWYERMRLSESSLTSHIPVYTNQGLTVTGSTTLNGTIRGNQTGGALRIQTDHGYTDVGAINGGWSHFYTDRPRYYLNKGITVDEGLIGSYDENLQLQTSATTRITVLNSNGNVGIGTATPSNAQGWEKVLDLYGSNHAKMLVTTGTGSVQTGVFSHFDWNNGTVSGARGVVGTESNHDLSLMAGYDNLHVTVKTNGNVGIGTTNPSEKLTVYDGEIAIQTDDDAEDQGIVFQNSGGYYSARMYRSYNSESGYPDLKFATGGDPDYTQLTDVMIIRNDGKVGIGKMAPETKLHVDGTVKATSFVSSAGSFPDYVFAEDYKITPLSELETYVKANRRLPNMPSEKEVVEKGLDLPGVVTKSVENIETIYLHLIRMEKEIKALQQDNIILKQENATLKQQLKQGR